MKVLQTRVEKGKYVTRLCGIRIWKRRETALSEQAALLRRELLTMADIGAIPPARGSARELQLAGLVLLREVMRVAQEGGFHPWCICGTLLGLVRQGGRFIPWDDDVDLGMIREDYARFSEYFNAHCAEGFYAWRRYSRKWNQIKISHRDLPKDVTMSVMPYDRYLKPLPTLAEKHALFRKVVAEQERVSKTFTAASTDADHFRALEDVRERVMLEGRGAAPDAAKPAIFRGVEFSVPGWELETVYDWEDVFPLRPATFEGIAVLVPNDPEAVLTYNYGDWAAWPGRLKPHHPASHFNMARSLAIHRFVKAHPALSVPSSTTSEDAT